MNKNVDPATQWVILILLSVLAGTCLLIAVAFIRRWQQIRYRRYVHSLQRQYRPVLAKVLSGAYSSSDVETLRQLPIPELEILLEPVFSKRVLPDRCMRFLGRLCAELGLIALWQRRANSGYSASRELTPDRGARGAGMRYALRAKSLRNLGVLRHHPSWRLLVNALDNRDPEIQFVALRSLARLGAPESFPVLRDRLHAVVEGKATSPAVQGLRSTMIGFDVACLPVLLPSLGHANRLIRLHGAEILRMIVQREAARQPRLVLTTELLSPEMAELLLRNLAIDTSSAIRACTAEIVVFLANPRTGPVLRNLLHDQQWFVRMRTIRALPHLRQPVATLHLDLRECLRDPHWRVREAAIRTLIALGRKGKRQLYEHFLTSRDRTSCEQIVEVIERTGLMSTLVEEYGSGTKGVDALMVEQLASEAAPLGLSGVLRTLNSDLRQKFLDRFLPYEEAKMRFLGEAVSDLENPISPQQVLEFPSYVAA